FTEFVIMLFTGARDIDITEYTNASITTTSARPTAIGTHTPLNFTGWKLAMAVSRTICNTHLGHAEYWLDAFSSLLSLSPLVHSHVNNVRIDSGRIQRLRDFSRTNRVGELSQG